MTSWVREVRIPNLRQIWNEESTERRKKGREEVGEGGRDWEFHRQPEIEGGLQKYKRSREDINLAHRTLFSFPGLLTVALEYVCVMCFISPPVSLSPSILDQKPCRIMSVCIYCSHVVHRTCSILFVDLISKQEGRRASQKSEPERARPVRFPHGDGNQGTGLKKKKKVLSNS